jgi:hypothetical protein
MRGRKKMGRRETRHPQEEADKGGTARELVLYPTAKEMQRILSFGRGWSGSPLRPRP